jgi:universal stress protein A
MNLTKILFPTDFSNASDAAFEYAQALAADSGATLFIAHVDQPDDVEHGVSATDYLYSNPLGGNDRSEIRQRLRNIRPTHGEVIYKHRYFRGCPATEILRFAKLEEIDLVVMGSHGRSGLSRLLMGSVAECVTRNATCPVFVVKQPAVALVGDAEMNVAKPF